MTAGQCARAALETAENRSCDRSADPMSLGENPKTERTLFGRRNGAKYSRGLATVWCAQKQPDNRVGLLAGWCLQVRTDCRSEAAHIVATADGGFDSLYYAEKRPIPTLTVRSNSLLPHTFYTTVWREGGV